MRQSLKSHPAGCEIPFLIFAVRKSTKIKRQSASADAQSLGKTVRRDGLSFLFVLIETRGGHRVSKGNSGLCGVRPGSTWTGQHTHIIRARRGNKDSGLRAARLDRARELVPWTPIVGCGRVFLTLSPVRDEVKLRESSAGSPGIRPKACWTVFGNHATIKRENHRTKRMISKT